MSKSSIDSYNKCHEIMLANDDYVAHECEGVSYLLVQIANRETDIAIQVHLVNPAIPDQGSMESFIELTEDQQTAILAMKFVSQGVRHAHQTLNKAKRLASDADDVNGLKASIQLIHDTIKGLRSHS